MIAVIIIGAALVAFGLWVWWTLRWEAKEYQDEHGLEGDK